MPVLTDASLSGTSSRRVGAILRRLGAHTLAWFRAIRCPFIISLSTRMRWEAVRLLCQSHTRRRFKRPQRVEPILRLTLMMRGLGLAISPCLQSSEKHVQPCFCLDSLHTLGYVPNNQMSSKLPGGPHCGWPQLACSTSYGVQRDEHATSPRVKTVRRMWRARSTCMAWTDTKPRVKVLRPRMLDQHPMSHKLAVEACVETLEYLPFEPLWKPQPASWRKRKRPVPNLHDLHCMSRAML